MAHVTIPEIPRSGRKFGLPDRIRFVHRGDTRRHDRLLASIVVGCALAGSASGCASVPWPDEPGIPVAVSRAANLQTEDQFIARLTADRQAMNLPPPITAAQSQAGIRVYADDLQAGKLSAPAAQRAIEQWGKATFHRTISAWVIDCAAGDAMKLPGALVDRPAAVVSFAAAHFRPRSSAGDQCAVLVVAAEGAAETTVEQKL
jgi:hypothetical protein